MLNKILATLLVLFFVQSVQAIKPISGSEQKHYANSKRQNHWVILGAIERIKGGLKPEGELRISGRVTQWLWKLPPGHNAQSAFDGIAQQLLADSRSLFQCEGRACGLSNDYANKVFKHSILYGRDSDQAYWVGLQNGRTDYLWVVYASSRANKGAHVYVERIQIPKEELVLLTPFLQQGQYQTLFTQHYIELSKLTNKPASLSGEQIDWIKEVLQQNPGKKFALVVHRYDGIDKTGLVEASQQEAQGLLDAIAEAGGYIQHLYAHGAGAMLPRGESRDRIELVEILE